jgi:hypothetical protein
MEFLDGFGGEVEVFVRTLGVEPASTGEEMTRN